MIPKTAILDIYALGLAFLEAGRHHGDWAVNRSGRAVAVDSPGAVRFCLVGALERAAYELGEAGPGRGPGPGYFAALAQLSPFLPMPNRGWLPPGHPVDAEAEASTWWELRGTLPAARAALSAAAHRLSSK